MIFLAYFEKKQYFCGRNVVFVSEIGCKGTTKNLIVQINREKTSVILGFSLRNAG